jgi:pentatricopeptide repeat protein
LHHRYVDIASFARLHARTYATSTARAATNDEPQHTRIALDDLGEIYGQDAVAKQAKDLTPEQAGRYRIKLIAQAEARLERQVKRLQRDKGRFQNKLLYDGQYRSLRRFVISLRRWRETREDVRTDNPIDPDTEHWILRAFAAFDRSTYPRVNALTKAVRLKHNVRCRHDAERLLDGVDGEDPERMWDNWQTFGEDKTHYQGLLVYLLDTKPGYVADFIMVLANDASLPDSKFVILADSLAHLARLHVKGEYPPAQGWELTSEASRHKFISVFLHCTREVLDTSVYSQDLLHSLAQFAEPEDLERIYEVLVQSRTRFAVGTSFHYASVFGQTGNSRLALRCLRRYLYRKDKPTRELIVDSELFRWASASILRGSMRYGKDYQATTAIVAALVEFGVKMDLLLYNVVMHNAMDAGDFATAFKVYNTLGENGLEPDKITFSVLLHGCAVQSDPAMFKDFADHCLVKARELGDSWLATEYLYYLYTCEQNKPEVERNMGALWRVYLDLFDFNPLMRFRLLKGGSRVMRDAMDRHVVDPEKQKLAATPMALYLMLQTEIQIAQTTGIQYLAKLYTTFKKAVSKDCHPTLQNLSQNPIIWNTFLYAFCAKTQYASASQVIKDMSSHSVEPNIYSWNIFMQSFFRTGQTQAAERVFAILRARNINPDTYTYGILVRGYAKAQLTDRIAEPMQHISPDDQLAPDLLRALSNVQARADLTAALEKSRLEKERKDREELERKEALDRIRFQPPRFASLLLRHARAADSHWDNGDASDAMEADDAEDKAGEQAVSLGAGETGLVEEKERGGSKRVEK